MTRLLPLMMVGMAFTGLAMMAQAEAINVPAPDFTLESRSGENLRLEDHRGEVVMLNFWASWCGPCRQEMPLMDDIYSQYKDLALPSWRSMSMRTGTKLCGFSMPCRWTTRFSMTLRAGSVSCTRSRPCLLRS